MWAVRPVFGDHFLLVREIGADRDQVLSLPRKGGRTEERWTRLGNQRSELILGSQREGDHHIPMGGHEFLRNGHSGCVKIF